MRDRRFDTRATALHELLLIRVGHHLWKSYKSRIYPENVALAALKAVWNAKEEVRVVLRQEHLETWEKRSERLALTGFKKARKA